MGDTAGCKAVAKSCCMALTADCLACSAGMSVEDYCSQNPDTAGCEAVAKPCCMGLTADCLACSAGVSVEDYCSQIPGTAGCETVAKPFLCRRFDSWEKAHGYWWMKVDFPTTHAKVVDFCAAHGASIATPDEPGQNDYMAEQFPGAKIWSDDKCTRNCQEEYRFLCKKDFTWHLGEKSASCNAVCAATSLTCHLAATQALDSNRLRGVAGRLGITCLDDAPTQPKHADLPGLEQGKCMPGSPSTTCEAAYASTERFCACQEPFHTEIILP